ncbi:rRNA maturation RNase YbeY [Patescibacteria group bacterium]
MIKIYVTKTCVCPVRSTLIKKTLKKFLHEKGLVDATVSVAIVGKSKMLSLARDYLDEKNTLHNVLSFTESEVSDRFVDAPDNQSFLGEIVICYSKVMEEANAERKMVDDKIVELVKHGTLHLLGIHHI